ncbi:MAG: PQQ-binding-like beta-propeller repeat protein [Acidobacteriota bacterium]
MFRFLLLLAAAAGPLEVERPIPPAAIEATTAWEVELPDTPSQAVRAVVLDGGISGLLVPYENAIEVRLALDGSLVWRREGLGAAGLMSGPPLLIGGVPTIGWSGADESGSAHFLLIAVNDGANRSETPLDSAPLGPPLPDSDGGSAGPQWYVPLAGGVVIVIDPAGRVEERLIASRAEISPPLVVVEGRICAFVGPHRRMVTLASLGQLESPRLLSPITAAAGSRRLFAAQANSLSAWHCRALSRGGLRCGSAWKQPTGAPVTAAPLVVDDLVFVPSWDSFLYAFRQVNGHLLWRVSTPGRLSATPLAWDELLAVAPQRSKAIGFYRNRDGASAGQIDAGNDEVFLSPPGRVDDRLVLAVSSPRADKPRTLRAYAVKRHVAPAPTPAASQEVSPLTAERNRSSSLR